MRPKGTAFCMFAIVRFCRICDHTLVSRRCNWVFLQVCGSRLHRAAVAPRHIRVNWWTSISMGWSISLRGVRLRNTPDPRHIRLAPPAVGRIYGFLNRRSDSAFVVNRRAAHSVVCSINQPGCTHEQHKLDYAGRRGVFGRYGNRRFCAPLAVCDGGVMRQVERDEVISTGACRIGAASFVLSL
jgi:hypothetical protein